MVGRKPAKVTTREIYRQQHGESLVTIKGMNQVQAPAAAAFQSWRLSPADGSK
jgi:hypothetical protein